MVIFGVLLVAIGLTVILFGKRNGSQVKVLEATPTIPCFEIQGAAATGELCEVRGTCSPGPLGMLDSPFSGTASVWHRARVDETSTERDADGSERENTRMVSDASSHQSFWLKDETGRVLIDARTGEFDRPEQSLDEYEVVGNDPSLSIGKVEWGKDEGVRIRKQEWIIRAGTELFISGKAVDTPTGAALQKPKNGRLFISTSTEEEIMSSTANTARNLNIGGGLAAVAGAALLLVGILS